MGVRRRRVASRAWRRPLRLRSARRPYPPYPSRRFGAPATTSHTRAFRRTTAGVDRQDERLLFSRRRYR